MGIIRKIQFVNKKRRPLGSSGQDPPQVVVEVPLSKKKSSGDLEKSSLKFEIPLENWVPCQATYPLATPPALRRQRPRRAVGRCSRPGSSDSARRGRHVYLGSLGCTKWGPIVKLVYTWFIHGLYMVYTWFN